MHKSVLLGKIRAKRHLKDNVSRPHGDNLNPETAHHRLARKALAHPRLIVTIGLHPALLPTQLWHLGLATA